MYRANTNASRNAAPVADGAGNSDIEIEGSCIEGKDNVVSKLETGNDNQSISKNASTAESGYGSVSILEIHIVQSIETTAEKNAILGFEKENSPWVFEE